MGVLPLVLDDERHRAATDRVGRQLDAPFRQRDSHQLGIAGLGQHAGHAARALGLEPTFGG